MGHRWKANKLDMPIDHFVFFGKKQTEERALFHHK